MKHALSIAAACLWHHRFDADADGTPLEEGEDLDWDRIDEARREIAMRLARRAGDAAPGEWDEPR